MDPKELRIGNWVTEKGRLIHIHDGFGIDHAHNFEPIPLTDSCFNKIIGDEISISYYNKFHECNFDIVFEKNQEGYFYTGGEGVKQSRIIKYVHELQNLVWELERIEIEFKNDHLQ